MVEHPEVTLPEPEAIRQQMDATRGSLSEKLEVLEQKVASTVEQATSAVTETVATVKESVQASAFAVKESVQASVDTVAETFDLNRQVQRHPWAMLGGSVALGFLGGWMLGGERGNGARGSSSDSMAGSTPLPAQAPRVNRVFAPAPEESPAAPPKPSWLAQMTASLAPEIEKLKGLAVGTLGGVARDLVTEWAPANLRGQLAGVMDDLTTKLGGEPISGPVLPKYETETASATERQMTGCG